MKALLKHYQAFATEEKAQPNKLFNKKKKSFDANTHMFTFLAILVQMTCCKMFSQGDVYLPIYITVLPILLQQTISLALRKKHKEEKAELHSAF